MSFNVTVNDNKYESSEDSSDEEILVTVEDFEGESDDNSIESIREYERHLAAVKQAMKIKGILEHTLAHGVFVGPVGSGKSSLLSRLVGEMPSSTSPSTGVANRVVQVEVRKSSVSVLNAFSTWLKILYDEEAIRLVTQVTSYLTNQETTSTLMDQANQLPVTTTSSVYENSSLEVPATASSSLSTQHDTLASQLQNVANSEANTPLSYPSGYVAPMGVFKNALHQGRLEHLRQHLRTHGLSTLLTQEVRWNSKKCSLFWCLVLPFSSSPFVLIKTSINDSQSSIDF